MEVISAIFILIFIGLFLYYFLNSNPEDTPSIPYVKHGHYPMVGHLFSFLRDRTKFLMECYQRYGTCFQIRLFNQRFILIFSPRFLLIFKEDPTFLSESRRQNTQYLINRESLEPLVVEFHRRLCDRMKNERVLLEKNNRLSEWSI